MENIEFKKLLKFYGDHGQIIGLRLGNNILTALTLGIYYPWARAAYLRYIYGETEYIDTRFVFHGIGKEVFIGFLKAIGILIVLYAILFASIFSKITPVIILGSVVFYLAFLFLIPVAIHGSNRYRLSRTSWRGIHFGYRGNLKEFVKLFLVEFFFTIITLGIYSSWFQVKVTKYIISHARFGSIEFRFDGQAIDLFIIKLKGFFLSIITLGIYSFWYYKELIAFEINNTKIVQNGKDISLRSTLSAGKIFLLLITNFLIVIFTLGIGTGIAINRVLRTALENIEFDSEIDASLLTQTEEEYKDASGDDLAGLLDLSII